MLNEPVEVQPDVWWLPGFADSVALSRDIDIVTRRAPLRHMCTARGFTMSVAMSNCGELGWVSDRRGYRYTELDPDSGQRWPPMPSSFHTLADRASRMTGFGSFNPDACLINRYEPSAQMGAHRDADERDFNAPVVSVSLGIPARFYMIGPERRGRSRTIDVEDGDVVVFGGSARRHFHGVRKLKSASHPRLGAVRWNLTMRKAG